jgi:multicomponent Na+:H+ antiporter subunit D
VSALLHAVAVVKVGVFSIVRVLTGVFGIDFLASIDVSALLSFVVSVTIIVASLVALSQDGLKRRLAFSTIAQLSYVVLGVALLSPKALLGGIIHIVLHAFGKITLFFCAGAILVGTGKKNISEMSGIGKRMPITMVAFFIGSLSIIGLPPLGGFISKWCLVLGSLEANQMPVLVVLLVSSLLNAAYFMPIVYHAFFSPLPEGVPSDRVHEWSSLCVIPLVITSAVSIALFFYPQPFYQLATMAVRAMTGG